MESNAEIRRIVDAYFSPSVSEGTDKTTSLADAVRRHVKPGMLLHFGYGIGAASCEIVRQFWGSRPQFTMIMSMPASTHAVNLIQAGLVSKLIFTNCAHTFPNPGVSVIIQNAYKAKSIELENWSSLSLMLRYLAGALGTRFMPTRSLIGSDMAEDNKDSFVTMEDPFGSGRRIGLVKALNPDVSIIHGLAADPYGNTILPPYSTDYASIWGAKASRNGAIVTVESIETTDFIRQHSSFVRLPGYLVNAVCLAPLGVHPNALSNHQLEELEGYSADNNFMIEQQKASEDPDSLSHWIEEWVLTCQSHEDYLRKLGPERISRLKQKLGQEQQTHRWESLSADSVLDKQYSAAEMLMVAAARQIGDRVQKSGCRTIFAGVGTGGLAAWLAYHELRKVGYDVDLVGTGIGYAPPLGDPFLGSPAVIASSKMLSDLLDQHGVSVSGEHNRCLGVLGAGQIDRWGNINSSKISEKVFLAGSGGSNDIASGAREVLAVAPQSPRRLVDRVSYITCPGHRIRSLVTTMGVFEKLGDGEEFVLTGYFHSPELSRDEQIRVLRTNCGWDLKVSPEVREVPAPTVEELALLRLHDPDGVFRGGS